MNFTLKEINLDILRNRLEVGLRWSCDQNRDEEGFPVENSELELPAELRCWDGTADVYAQGPVGDDSVRVGIIPLSQLEGAETFAELDIAAEKIVRAELARLNIVAGTTEFWPSQWDDSTTPVVPVTMGVSA